MKIKNLSSVILSAMMAVSVVPTTGVTAPYSNFTSYAVEAEAVTEDEFVDISGVFASGECGENAVWNLYDGGTLVISGEGAMNGYELPEYAPWAKYADMIQFITIDEYITEIGTNAFESCENLFDTLIYNPDCIIPDSETAIPSGVVSGYNGSTAQAYAEKYNVDFCAFATEIASGFCGENVSWVLYDNGVLSVSGEGAMDSFDDFSNTPWAEYVDTVNDIDIWEVTKIGDNTFVGFENVEYIHIYNSECEIADSETVFPANAVIDAEINSIAQAYAEKYGLGFCPFLYEVTNGVFENGLRWKLDSDGYLVLEGEDAMLNCDGANPWDEFADDIAYVGIDSHISSVGDYAFYNCENLHTVLNNVSVIGAHAFEGCTNLVDFDKDTWGTLDKIGDYAFYNTNIETITIKNPECEITMSPYVFPEDTVIYGYKNSTAEAYAEKYDREFVVLGSGIWGEFDNGIEWHLNDDGILGIEGTGVMPDYDGANPWGEYADEIKSVDFAFEFTAYGDYAFYNCKNLKCASLPSVVGAHAFEGCVSLEILAYYGDYPVHEIKDYAFYGCDSLQLIEIVDTECVIADSPNVFPENTAIYAYEGSTAEAYAEKYNREFVSLDKIHAENTIAEGMCGEELTWSLDKWNTLTIAGTGDMTNWESYDDTPWAEYSDIIYKVMIEGNVNSVSVNSFDGLTVEEPVIYFFNNECIIAEGSIPEKAVISCDSGSTAHAYAIEHSIRCVVDGTFVDESSIFTWSCNEAGDIFYITGYGDMPEYEIGERPWEDVIDQMEYIYFYGNVRSISPNAFAGCKNLKFVDIDESIMGIQENAFKGCDSLETLNFHGNYDCYIDDSADTIPSQTVIIAHEGSPAYEYAEKYGLEHYGISEDPLLPFASGEFGNGFTWEIYDDCNEVFISGYGDMPEWETPEEAPWAEYLDVIEMVMIDENVTSIPANLFDGMTDDNIIVYVYNDDCVIPDAPGVIPYDAFMICGQESIAHTYAEKYCISHIADDCEVEYHHEDFTWSCNEAGDIFYITGYGDMPDYEIGERPWEDVIDQMESVYFYGDITSIGKNAFAGSDSLRFVDVDEKIAFIGENAFAGCESLETLNFHGNYICEIYDSASTIPAYTTIIAHEGTPAQAYADKYSMTYYGIAGDANCDGKVSIADATTVFQCLGNPDKYTLSEEGRRNADVAGDGNGITVEDAIFIQRYDAKLIEEL